jgi:hypothetical protein
VATTADSYSVRRASAQAPISTHPAFPAIAALWFAALLGIGSLVLPVALIERFVSVTGLAVLIPSAAPPLGFTARAGIALGGAIAGALVGLVLARKVAEAHAPEPRARPLKFEDVRQCRPILAHDELGEEGLGSETVPAQAHKRRALAIVEDDARSTYLQTVPLPGSSADEPTTFAAPDQARSPATRQPEEVEPEPLELAPFTDPSPIDEDDSEAPEVTANAALDALRSRIHLPVESLSLQDQPMTDRPSSDIPQVFEPAPDAADPLPFAAPSLRRAEASASHEDEVDETFEESSVPHLSIIEDAGEPETIDDDRPLAELGLVQLAARLGASLAKRRARQVLPAPVMAQAPASPLVGTEDFEAVEADEAARAIADFFGPNPIAEPTAGPFGAEPEAAQIAIPAPLRAWSLDSDDDADDDGMVASFSLPLTKASVAPAMVDEDDPTELEEPAEDGDYSSLLAMKNPFARQQEFVRVEEPEDRDDTVEPTVTFPSLTPAPPLPAGSEQRAAATSRPFDPPKNPAKTVVPAPAPLPSRDPGDAERNLRAALATLQRMSGAA